MSFKSLFQFITKKMRMSHIYQPVMIMALLDKRGRCPDVEIAKALLANDESQIEYYTAITNNMVGRVLRSHGIVERDRTTRTYQLLGYERLSAHDISVLREACKQKLVAFVERRGSALYAHRGRPRGYISGTLKYEVFKRAAFRCELCGVSAGKRALEVDHIAPRNWGGTDDPTNLQALCYSCNAMKRDRDDTDFRDVPAQYDVRQRDCLFCTIPKDRIVREHELAYVIRDGFPVTEGHSLIIPRRHISSYFSLLQPELNATNALVFATKNELEETDSSITGFNVGINSGESAGQTIFHCHIHLIPRRSGDVESPRGGIRNVIPGKGAY